MEIEKEPGDQYCYGLNLEFVRETKEEENWSVNGEFGHSDGISVNGINEEYSEPNENFFSQKETHILEEKTEKIKVIEEKENPHLGKNENNEKELKMEKSFQSEGCKKEEKPGSLMRLISELKTETKEKNERISGKTSAIDSFRGSQKSDFFQMQETLEIMHSNNLGKKTKKTHARKEPNKKKPYLTQNPQKSKSNKATTLYKKSKRKPRDPKPKKTFPLKPEIKTEDLDDLSFESADLDMESGINHYKIKKEMLIGGEKFASSSFAFQIQNIRLLSYELEEEFHPSCEIKISFEREELIKRNSEEGQSAIDLHFYKMLKKEGETVELSQWIGEEESQKSQGEIRENDDEFLDMDEERQKFVKEEIKAEEELKEIREEEKQNEIEANEKNNKGKKRPKNDKNKEKKPKEPKKRKKKSLLKSKSQPDVPLRRSSRIKAIKEKQAELTEAQRPSDSDVDASPTSPLNNLTEKHCFSQNFRIEKEGPKKPSTSAFFVDEFSGISGQTILQSTNSFISFTNESPSVLKEIPNESKKESKVNLESKKTEKNEKEKKSRKPGQNRNKENQKKNTREVENTKNVSKKIKPGIQKQEKARKKQPKKTQIDSFLNDDASLYIEDLSGPNKIKKPLLSKRTRKSKAPKQESKPQKKKNHLTRLIESYFQRNKAINTQPDS